MIMVPLRVLLLIGCVAFSYLSLVSDQKSLHGYFQEALQASPKLRPKSNSSETSSYNLDEDALNSNTSQEDESKTVEDYYKANAMDDYLDVDLLEAEGDEDYQDEDDAENENNTSEESVEHRIYYKSPRRKTKLPGKYTFEPSETCRKHEFFPIPKLSSLPITKA